MDIKRVAVAGVIVERRRKLEVNDVRELKSCPHLPFQKERIVVRDFLSFAAYRLRNCRLRANWIFRVGVVINKLPEISEDIELQERLRFRPELQRLFHPC